MKIKQTFNKEHTWEEYICQMSQGNEEALQILFYYYKQGKTAINYKLAIADLYSLEIYGKDIKTMIKTCCGNNIKLFNQTVELLKATIDEEELFTKEEIEANLSLEEDAIPFIDKAIPTEIQEKKLKYYKFQKESFKERLEKQLSKKQKTRK